MGLTTQSNKVIRSCVKSLVKTSKHLILGTLVFLVKSETCTKAIKKHVCLQLPGRSC